MEAPPLSTPRPTTPTTPPPPLLCPDSVKSFDAEPQPPARLRLMCSYGGHIVPRPHDKTLCYVGGDTRIIGIDRHTSLSDLHHRLSKNLLNNQPFSLKYQLPSEDLDSLITVTSDEDFDNVVEEYDRLNNSGGGRLRLFLFTKSPASIEPAKSEDWFFNALNGKTSTISESSSVNCLLGLDDDFIGKAVEKDVEAQIEGLKDGNINGNYVINHDVHSIPDSPMLGTTSSFGSTSSSPSVANLPPIRTHVDDNPKVGALGIEEQFQQMSFGGVGNANPPPPQKQEKYGAFIATGAAAGPVVSGLRVVVGGDYSNRIISDDERSDHSGHGNTQQIQQVQFQPQQIPLFQQKQANALDLSSPDSVSSEGSISNAVSRQRQAIYQEPLIQIQSGNTKDQQIQESSYVITNQYDQNHPQLHQPQQFIHPSSHYIPSTAVPSNSYYSVYPPHHQNHPHQYPVYFVPGKQAQSYKPEMAQPQYVGYSPIHQPTSGPNSGYAYEFSGPAHPQVYYTPLPPQFAAQYQTMTSASDASAESMKLAR